MKNIIYILFVSLIILASTFAPSFAQAQTKDAFVAFEVDTSLWKYLRVTDRSQWKISAEDSVSAYQDYFLQGYRVYQQIRKISGNKRLTSQEKVEKLYPLLKKAEGYFEDALQINPFTPNLKIALKAVYSYLDQICFAKKLENERYGVLHKRLILETGRKARQTIFYNLAVLNFSHQYFDLTINNCNRAIDLIFSQDSAKIDTTLLFKALFQRGAAEYKLYRGNDAARTFTYASMIAPENYKKQIGNYLRTLEWDDGNIKSAELFSNAQKSIKEKNYEQAAHFLKEMLNIASTLRVRRTIQYQLAMIEFYQLAKKEDGINRAWVQKKVLQSLPDSSAEIDSVRSRFLNLYADMCFRLANDARKENRKQAFAYFYEITKFENRHRPRAYYFLASLSINNDDLCLQYCQKANEYWQQLTKQDKVNLAMIFYSAYLNRGDFDEAIAWYKKYFDLKKS